MITLGIFKFQDDNFTAEREFSEGKVIMPASLMNARVGTMKASQRKTYGKFNQRWGVVILYYNNQSHNQTFKTISCR